MNQLSSTSGVQALSDHELYKRCQEYGGNARLWLRKFGGLLPEVYRRHLYKKKGCASIYEFAKKLAGMNEATVDRILYLSRKFEDKPALRVKLENGSIGWSKLRVVANIVTVETDQKWAKKVEELGKPVLEAYVQEYQKACQSDKNGFNSVPGDKLENNLSFWGEAQGGSLEVMQVDRQDSGWKTFSFHMSPETELKLRYFKQQFEREKKQAMSWNEVMMEMAKRLDAMQATKTTKAQKTIELCPSCITKRANEAEIKDEVARYIPAEVRNVIETRSRGKCEFQNCNYPPEIYHHTRRFALKKNHDPDFIRALCKKHEGILQAGLVENEEGEPSTWNIRNKSEWWDIKNIIDEKVAVFRREQ